MQRVCVVAEISSKFENTPTQCVLCSLAESLGANFRGVLFLTDVLNGFIPRPSLIRWQYYPKDVSSWLEQAQKSHCGHPSLKIKQIIDPWKVSESIIKADTEDFHCQEGCPAFLRETGKRKCCCCCLDPRSEREGNYLWHSTGRLVTKSKCWKPPKWG